MNTVSDSIDRTEFDVRSIPCRVKHAQIFQRWLDLPVGSYFVLINDHDPVPLRYQFAAEFPGAFSWEYKEAGSQEFRVKITKLRSITPPRSEPPLPKLAATSIPLPQPGAGKLEEIDVRGLEPPEPLIRILSALELLPENTTLRAVTDREPCHLFGEAQQRGFRYECKAEANGSWVTLLQRA